MAVASLESCVQPHWMTPSGTSRVVEESWMADLMLSRFVLRAARIGFPASSLGVLFAHIFPTYLAFAVPPGFRHSELSAFLLWIGRLTHRLAMAGVASSKWTSVTLLDDTSPRDATARDFMEKNLWRHSLQGIWHPSERKLKGLSFLEGLMAKSSTNHAFQWFPNLSPPASSPSLSTASSPLAEMSAKLWRTWKPTTLFTGTWPHGTCWSRRTTLPKSVILGWRKKPRPPRTRGSYQWNGQHQKHLEKRWEEQPWVWLIKALVALWFYLDQIQGKTRLWVSPLIKTQHPP